MRSKLFFLAILLTALPYGALAASASNILISVVPENPAPGETVTVSLKSYINNLDSVPISWAVNGRSAATGTGKKTFSVTAPAAGVEMRISASITLPDGRVEKILVLKPSVMSLLWQANNAYVPPFYRGKALPTTGSEVKVVAIPEIKSGPQAGFPKNMVYAWKKDYDADQAASGYGKNFYIYTGDYFETQSVLGVVASTADQKYSSSGEVTIGTFEPEIFFYRVDPEIGVRWEETLFDGHVVGGEEVIAAAPYFLYPKDIRVPSFSWDWSINGIYISVPRAMPNFLPVQAQPGVSGSSDIKLEISNRYNLLTSAKKELRVEF